MFGRLIGLVVLVFLGGALASWLAAQPGMLAFEWFGWQVEMRTSLAVAILVFTAVAILFVDRLLRGLLNLPAWLGRNLARRRTDSGHRALALGLMAVSAGEPDEARRQAARAQRLLSAPHLTDLLSAQAAHLAGDSQAAGRYFTSLTQDSDTAFLGHIGLARLALEDDRTDDALASARQALGLRPKSAMAARQVLALEAERGNWAAAMPALQIVASDRDRSDIDDAIIARQRAALFYLDTLDQAEANPNVKDTAKDQITRLNAALTAWPEFWPAALRLADLYEESGTPKKAIKPLEKSFRAMPHTDVAARLAELWQVNEGSQISRLLRLIPADAADVALADEGRCVVAEHALMKGLIGEARRLLEDISASRRDVAAWRLIGQIAREDEDDDSVTAALQQAGDAPRSRRWQCTSCQLVHDEWASHCGGCAGFATLGWQRPDGATPMLAAKVE